MPCTEVKRTALMRGNLAACARPYDMHEEFKHRDKLSPNICCINACVARPVSKSEIVKSPGAKASLDSEWKRLRDKS
eukprot:8243773-Heterocapsa_arctica.AAC.1